MKGCFKKGWVLIGLAGALLSCGPRSGIPDSLTHSAKCDVKSSIAEDTTVRHISTPEQEHGKSVFMKHCSQCHAPIENSVCSNGLTGIFDRIPKGDWFKSFILNSDSLKNEKDPYALNIEDSFNADYEHLFKKELTSKDIMAIADYLKCHTEQ